MTTDINYEEELNNLERKWEKITTIPETPQSVMSIIEHGLGKHKKAELYVNRILRYFLDPDSPHGMDAEFLRAFLEGLSDKEDVWTFNEDLYDLSNVRVDDQVRVYKVEKEDEETPADARNHKMDEKNKSFKIPDLVIEAPKEWFLIIELKFSAEETGTEFYCDSTHIRDQSKNDYESGKYYLYMHQKNSSPASGECFVNWTWRDFIDDVLKDFITENSPRFPNRTTVQLREFMDDIQEVSGMKEPYEKKSEKIELYLKHYEAIKDVTEAFNQRWDNFTNKWAEDLSKSLVEKHDEISIGLPSRMVNWLTDIGIDSDEYSAVEFSHEEKTPDIWIFRVRHKDWAHIFKEGWWRKADDRDIIYERNPEGEDIRIGFHHRMDFDRDTAISEKKLKFYFRNMGANPNDFKDSIYKNFTKVEDKISDLIPDHAEVTGNKLNMIQATYDINTARHENFFEAYIAALKMAFEDFIVKNKPLITTIDAVYNNAISEIYEDSIEL